MSKCGASRAEATGDYRRRVEVISELSFLIETDDFSKLISKLGHYGGKAERLTSDEHRALFKLALGVLLNIERANTTKWGLARIVATGAANHLRKLDALGNSLGMLATSPDSYPTEPAAYRALGVSFIEPELREGRDEIEIAAQGNVPGPHSR